MPLHARLVRLLLPLALILAVGSVGFRLTEGWPFEQSIYFTIITFTTVGYDDYDLTLMGKRFASVIIILGFGCFTYVLGQIVQIVVEHELDWERTMNKKIRALSDHFIIVGFGQIGKIVCQRLRQEQIPFVIVDRDRDLVEEAARGGVLAFAADATNDEVLDFCRIQSARGLICLTTSDANNIVITLSARALRPDLNIISRAESDDHTRKLRRAGATRVISPTQTGALAIAHSIIRPHLIDFLDQGAQDHDSLEFSKLTVAPGSTLEGQPIARAPVCAGSPLVIVAVQHEDGTTHVRPDDEMQLVAGDTLIIAGHPGAVVSFCTDAA